MKSTAARRSCLLLAGRFILIPSLFSRSSTPLAAPFASSALSKVCSIGGFVAFIPSPPPPSRSIISPRGTRCHNIRRFFAASSGKFFGGRRQRSISGAMSTTKSSTSTAADDGAEEGDAALHKRRRRTSSPIAKKSSAVHAACPRCLGDGRIRASHSKKARAKHKRDRQAAEAAGLLPPPPPPPRTEPCRDCGGTGLVSLVSSSFGERFVREAGEGRRGEIAREGIPSVVPGVRVAVVGGGIGGLALALALVHRGVPCDVYERDASFEERAQGYGLTMQQGARAVRSLGLLGGEEEEQGEEEGGDSNGGKGEGGGGGRGGFGIHSKRHVVHTPDGTPVGQWGMKVWGRPETKAKHASRQNAHVARQELRRMLLERLELSDPGAVNWGYQLVGYREGAGLGHGASEGGGEKGHGDAGEGKTSKDDGRGVEMTFVRARHSAFSADSSSEEETVIRRATVLVGADGIRSAVRARKIGDDISPLRYLGCIVILGIAPSPAHELSDGETVFQTADGRTRIYAMPFAETGKETAGAAEMQVGAPGGGGGRRGGNRPRGETMWQLSFPLDEASASDLSRRGPTALKEEAFRRCGTWHDPIPELLSSTPEGLVSGYPVYDRELLSAGLLRKGTRRQSAEDEGGVVCGEGLESEENGQSGNASRVTLIGDAAHPMSPFKGQGANQALLDAVLLARSLYRAFRVTPPSPDNTAAEGGRPRQRRYDTCTVEEALAEFERSMLKRSTAKVEASARAAEFLHSDVAIAEGNFPRCTAANNAAADHASSVEKG